MDYKLEYMERLFAKIGKKKTESYVISRIWHQLDDDRVKFVVQQYIRRTQDKYALADLYLPQLNIFIEINEPFHKNNVEVDKIRNEEIVNKTHSELCIIDCGFITRGNNGKDEIHWKPLDEIHRQVSDVVKLIKQRISELGGKFKPWDDASTLTVEYPPKQRLSESGGQRVSTYHGGGCGSVRHESQAPGLPACFGCRRPRQKARNNLVAEHGTPPLVQRTFGGWNVYLRISESGGKTCGTFETMAVCSRRNKDNIFTI